MLAFLKGVHTVKFVIIASIMFAYTSPGWAGDWPFFTESYFADFPSHYFRHPDPKDVLLNYKYPKSQPLEISEKNLGFCLALVSAKVSNFKIDSGNMLCHWYPKESGIYKDIENQYGDNNNAPSWLDYLSGQVRLCDWTSGHEGTLENWVWSRADNSISILELYKKSLELNDGNIWNALLTNYQLLRNYARFWETMEPEYGELRYPLGAKIKTEVAEKFFNKFQDFRGDLRSRGRGFSGDPEGSWYRIWGAMLWRLTRYSKFYDTQYLKANSCGNTQDIESSKLGEKWRRFLTHSTFYGDEVIGKANEERDKYKFELDVKASDSAYWLLKSLRDMSNVSENITEDFCNNSGYLVPRRQPVASSKRP